MLGYQDKHFRIHGRKTFLYGAECHYFRVDPADWSDRLQKIKNAGFNLVSTYVPWLWHEPTEGSFDFEGSTHPRRNLAEFLDLCASYDLYCIVRPGPYVMSELKNEGIPQWLLDSYPEVIARTSSGLHPARVVSYLHPTYLRLVDSWYKEVCARITPRLITNGGSIIMYQLDNEIGMLHWVTNTPDHHPYLLERFQEFIDKHPNPAARADASVTSHWAWAAFTRHIHREYVTVLKNMARANGIDVPFIVNVHGFKDFSVYSRGVDYPIGLSQLREAALVDDVVLAGDFYPGQIGYDNFHDLLISSAFTDAIGQAEQPLFSAEFQSGRLSDRPRVHPSDVDLITRLCVASGMNALNYYMYCGGDNVLGIGLFGRRHEWQAPIASNGDLRPSYEVTSHLGSVFATFGEALCDAPKVVDTHVGFYTPYYATETVSGNDSTIRSMISQIEGQREQFHFDGVWRLLSAANISFGAVDVQRDSLDGAKYPTLWMCTTKYMDRETQQKLADYVCHGGRLVLGPQIPTFDLNGEFCDVLARACNATVVAEHEGFQRVTICDVDSVFCRQYTVFNRVDDAHTIAFGEQGENEIAAYLRPQGDGQVLVLGVGLTHEYQYHLEIIHRLAKAVGIRPRLKVSDENVIVGERAGSSGSFISVMNMDDFSRVTTVERFGSPAFGGNPVHVSPRSGKLLPVQYAPIKDVVLNYSTVEVVQVNATDHGVDVLLSVPSGHTGVVSWMLGKSYALESDCDHVSIDLQPDGSHRVDITSEHHTREVKLRIVPKQPMIELES